ncbi:hypothetical protein DAEQUDRAFT_811314 [Daedalea quercina L-15889]|uniref:COI1 F-box domain-containing protein n=1 Tax=Daedalea quercina L-15889 TaxID=1314783 RepID=A0A165QJ60_9APHY|nr:hypothetical protein DAEQUDRAFT_811314 [Daedalea quercina L-15889]
MKPLQEILDHPCGSGDVDWDAYYFAPNPSHILFPLPPSLSIRVPFDVLTHVIAFLDSEADRSTVALVCKDWYRWLGHHRYPDLCIRSRETVNALLGLYLRSERVQRRLKHTKTLKCESGRDVKWRQVAGIPLQVLATYMPAVRRFVFRGYAGDGLWSEMHVPGFAKVLRSFRSLHNLELSGFLLDNFYQLARIILACPSLETLILRDGELINSYLPRALAEARPTRIPHLRRLELCHLELDLLSELVDSLVERRVACCDNVTDLTITEIAGVAAELLTRLLRVIGPSLQRLTLARMPWTRNLQAYHSLEASTLSLAWNTSIQLSRHRARDDR